MNKEGLLVLKKYIKNLEEIKYKIDENTVNDVTKELFFFISDMKEDLIYLEEDYLLDD